MLTVEGYADDIHEEDSSTEKSNETPCAVLLVVGYDLTGGDALWVVG